MEARFRGAKGDRGKRGPGGEPLSAALRRALAYLFVAMFLLIALAYYGLYREQQASNQQRCGSIAKEVSVPVPVPTLDNPSRAWEARQEQIDRTRGMQLHCALPPARYAPSGAGP